jgi:hypothetical protein
MSVGKLVHKGTHALNEGIEVLINYANLVNELFRF